MELQDKLKKLKEMANNNDENTMAYLEEVSSSCTSKEAQELLSKFTEELLQDIHTSMDNLETDIDEFKIKEKLGDLTEIINFSYVARAYFNKSKQWLYQRINNYNVNGKPAKFTPEEQLKFNHALNDIKSKIAVFTA